MRAVRVHDILPVFEQDLPEPAPGPGEALVEIDAACIAPLDLQIARGEFPLRPPAPYVPGSDGAGRVVAGDEILSGRRVWIRGSGVGFTRDGCWADRVALPHEALHALDEGVDPVLAATFFVPCATARTALHEVGGLRPNEVVGVRGAAGAVGRLAVQMALADGAAEVIAIVGSSERRAAVPAGARVVVAPGPVELHELAGAGIDLLVDTVGGRGFGALVPSLRQCGRIVLVGYAAGTTIEFDSTALLVHEVSIFPVNGMRWEREVIEHADTWLDMLGRGDLELPTLAHAPEELEVAIQAVLTSPSRGRVALQFRQ